MNVLRQLERRAAHESGVDGLSDLCHRTPKGLSCSVNLGTIDFGFAVAFVFVEDGLNMKGRLMKADSYEKGIKIPFSTDAENVMKGFKSKIS